MKIYIIAVGKRMPEWVRTGYEEYARRMLSECKLELIEVSAKKRSGKFDVKRLLREEGEALLAAVPKRALIIVLDRRGKTIDTKNFAQAMDDWMQQGVDVALLIGGPEGLSRECISQANQVWSLSMLTMAHPVVRVVLAEQIYRAWSLLRNLPYHRGD
ncbi:23S rRNA (pseudouridine(1915)-N(3))-methyltransferase RlmH [Pseudomonadota bacterium]